MLWLSLAPDESLGQLATRHASGQPWVLKSGNPKIYQNWKFAKWKSGRPKMFIGSWFSRNNLPWVIGAFRQIMPWTGKCKRSICFVYFPWCLSKQSWKAKWIIHISTLTLGGSRFWEIFFATPSSEAGAWPRTKWAKHPKLETLRNAYPSGKEFLVRDTMGLVPVSHVIAQLLLSIFFLQAIAWPSCKRAFSPCTSLALSWRKTWQERLRQLDGAQSG